MSTYGEMQTNIATFLRRDDLSTEIPTAIKRAIAHYGTEPWPWLEERSTSLTTAANTKTVSPPSDFGRDLSMSVTVNSIKYPLSKKPMQYLEELYYADSLTESPFLYAYWDQVFYLYPIPDDAYTLTLNYFEDLAALADSDDSNAWTTTAEELIEARAMWWLATAVMRNAVTAENAKGRELEAYNRLRARATLQASSGKLRSSATRNYYR